MLPTWSSSPRRRRDALHQHVIAERSRAQGLIQAATAERATRLRRQAETIDQAVIDAAWPLLVAALQQRWQEPAPRHDWIAMALSQALSSLPEARCRWEIQSAPLDAADLAVARAQVQAATGAGGPAR